jgi:hypothetical protein
MRVAGNDKAVTNTSCPLVMVASAVERELIKLREKTALIVSIKINKEKIIPSFKNVRTRNEEIYFTLTDLERSHNEG